MSERRCDYEWVTGDGVRHKCVKARHETGRHISVDPEDVTA